LRRVRFRGPLYGEEKLQAYARADVYVLPSWSENFGYTVAEALACRTPAITTRATPWGALESHGCGWWIDPGVEPLVTCLDAVLAMTRTDLDQMGRNGRDFVARELSWAGIAAHMEQSYQWLLGKADQPACVLI
jgi:glycosyltransferase involved in cell wall biosynthesis